MALGALKLRYVAKIHRVLKCPVGLMAESTLVVSKRAELNRMLERSSLHVCRSGAGRVVDHSMANVAVVPDNFAGATHVLAVMAAKASRRIKVADVVRMSLPVNLHLGKEISLIDTLDFSYGSFD